MGSSSPSSSGGDSQPKKKKPEPRFNETGFAERGRGAPPAPPKPRTPVASSGASRRAPPNIAEERSAIRAPGQRPVAEVQEERRGRPKEPGGVDDRAPVMSAPQRAYESIQELRGRREKTVPGTLGVMSRLSLDSQIKKLQEGGTPIISGTMTVGVVSKGGSYTGRPEYADLARTQYKAGGSEIRVPIGAKRVGSRDNGESKAPPAPAPDTSTPKIGLPSTGGDTGDAQRRAMLSSGAGAAIRRKYLGK
ncbi:MAG: hypothetical protein VW879_05235 [Opitutae bacterium]